MLCLNNVHYIIQCELDILLGLTKSGLSKAAIRMIHTIINSKPLIKSPVFLEERLGINDLIKCNEHSQELTQMLKYTLLHKVTQYNYI